MPPTMTMLFNVSSGSASTLVKKGGRDREGQVGSGALKQRIRYSNPCRLQEWNKFKSSELIFESVCARFDRDEGGAKM